MLIHSGMTTLAGSPLHYLDRNWKSDTNGSNPQNTSGYRNAAFDALSDALAAEADPAKQKQKILLDDTAVIVFGYPKTNIVSRTGIIHADVNPCDDYRITRDWKRKE